MAVKLDKELIPDAIELIWDYEYPQSFYTIEDLAKAINSSFDCEVNPDDLVSYIIPYTSDAVDRQLILKNIGE